MKYAPGLMVGQLSGSTGSTTASKNRYGSYFRSRTVPVNPNSVSQQGVRAVFGNLSQNWRALDEAQRQGWSDLAPNVPRTNSLGVQYVLSGNAMYVSLNAQRDAVGLAALDDAPALDAAPVITSVSLAAVADETPTMLLTYAATGGSGTNFIIIRASAPRSPGRQFIGRGELKQIALFNGNEASPIDIAAEYEAVFGTAWQSQAGMEIAVEIFPVSPTGFAGVGVRDQALITLV